MWLISSEESPLKPCNLLQVTHFLLLLFFWSNHKVRHRWVNINLLKINSLTFTTSNFHDSFAISHFNQVLNLLNEKLILAFVWLNKSVLESKYSFVVNKYSSIDCYALINDDPNLKDMVNKIFLPSYWHWRSQFHCYVKLSHCQMYANQIKDLPDC